MNNYRKLVPIAVQAALAAGLSASVPGFAQQAQKVEKIEVTGSNIRRVEGESALPVTIISRDEIDRTGVTTAAELLDKVSANSGGGYNVSQGVGDSGTPGLSAASLRGLGSTNTLVLLNGRRLSNYAFNSTGGGTVNLNQIPLAAVERVEILKDGASAIYGTDAIGGVINFILRKDFAGIEASAYGTKTDDGGARQRRYTATLGYGDISRQRFNVLAAFDYEKDDPLLASQRKFGSTAIRPDLGFSRTSGNTFPANFRFGGRTLNVTAAQDCRPDQGTFHVNAATGAPAPLQNFCRYDFTSVLDIYPPSERKGFFTRGAFALTPDHELFAEYHLSKNKITFASSETPVNDFTGNGPFLYPAGGPFYPTTVTLPNGSVVHPTGALPIAWRLKQGGRRTDRVDTDESRVVAGAQGIIAGWDYNTAFNRSQSKATDNYVDGWVRESALRAAIATGLVDVFSGNAQNAAGQALIDNAKILQSVRDSKATVTGWDGRVSRDLMQLRNGTVAVALGLEHRKEQLDDRPAEVLFSGDVQGGGGAQPATRADRKISAAFAELNVPILKNLEAQFAVRYDHYSDFGNTTNPKVALRYAPTRELLLRGSYSTGFRAPTLSDRFLPRFIGNTADNHSDPIRCPGSNPIGGFVNEGLECDAQLQAQFGGNQALTPERSRQWTLGMVFEPIQNSSLGIDFWKIMRRNSISALGDNTIFDTYAVSDPLTAAGRFVRYTRLADGSCQGDLPGSPTPASVPCAINYVVQVQENLGKFNISGLDVSALSRVGPVNLRLDGTYFMNYRYQVQRDGQYLDNVGLVTSTNGAIPRWRHYASATYRFRPFSVTLANNYMLGYLDDSGTRRVASYETFDLSGLWDAWRGLSVSAGVKNILNRDPPASDQGQTFQVGYDPRYTDPRGRTFWLGLKYAFR